MSTISEPIIPSITSSSFLPHSSSPSSPSLDPSKTCIQVVQTEQSLLENDSTTPGVRETLSNNSSSSPKLSPSNPDHHDQNLSSKRKRDGPSHKLNLSKSAKLDNQSLSNSTCNLDIQDLGFDPFHPHPGMTKDQRKLARMIRNRTAAQASRDRKKEHVAELENRVKELESQLEVALSRQHKCPRPCCRVTDEPLVQASSSMIDPAVVASSLSARIHAVPVHPNNSIDPSIIRLGRSNLVSQSGKEIEPDFLNALDATSRELVSHGSVTTLSPAQSEYLSQARIHILEEENTQLKSQLEFELKKAQQLRVRSINNNFQGLTSETLESDALDIGGSLVKLILGDQKLTNTNCDPLSDKSKIVSKFSSPSEGLDPQSSELKSNEILDWNSLLSENGLGE
ncbi:hypothetical protein BY996DRAFT_4042430 [Phakopsora pachyrhizi]|nr:hypothetical protein BY996DRAFT_4042430 [Phakopsora pachyrhizi]